MPERRIFREHEATTTQRTSDFIELSYRAEQQIQVPRKVHTTQTQVPQKVIRLTSGFSRVICRDPPRRSNLDPRLVFSVVLHHSTTAQIQRSNLVPLVAHLYLLLKTIYACNTVDQPL